MRGLWPWSDEKKRDRVIWMSNGKSCQGPCLPKMVSSEVVSGGQKVVYVCKCGVKREYVFKD